MIGGSARARVSRRCFDFCQRYFLFSFVAGSSRYTPCLDFLAERVVRHVRDDENKEGKFRARRKKYRRQPRNKWSSNRQTRASDSTVNRCQILSLAIKYDDTFPRDLFPTCKFRSAHVREGPLGDAIATLVAAAAAAARPSTDLVPSLLAVSG